MIYLKRPILCSKVIQRTQHWWKRLTGIVATVGFFCEEISQNKSATLDAWVFYWNTKVEKVGWQSAQRASGSLGLSTLLCFLPHPFRFGPPDFQKAQAARSYRKQEIMEREKGRAIHHFFLKNKIREVRSRWLLYHSRGSHLAQS